jgi:hypothetical protein
MSVIESDIPPGMTVAQYRRRHAAAGISPGKARVRLLGGRR